MRRIPNCPILEHSSSSERITPLEISCERKLSFSENSTAHRHSLFCKTLGSIIHPAFQSYSSCRELHRDPDVTFAGYQIPHPLEYQMLIKVNFKKSIAVPSFSPSHLLSMSHILHIIHSDSHQWRQDSSTIGADGFKWRLQ